MSDAKSKRILILANRTAVTPKVVEVVRQRAKAGDSSFALLITAEDPTGEEAEEMLELSVPILEEAAGEPIARLIGNPNPVLAVREALEREGGFDEVIIATLPERVSRWLRRDLPRRIEQLGVPVTVVVAKQAQRPVWAEETYERAPWLP